MKTIHQWLSEYGESHQDHTNKTIHWICVPLIFFSIVGLLYSIKLPFVIAGLQLNVAIIVLALTTIYAAARWRPPRVGYFPAHAFLRSLPHGEPAKRGFLLHRRRSPFPRRRRDPHLRRRRVDPEPDGCVSNFKVHMRKAAR